MDIFKQAKAKLKPPPPPPKPSHLTQSEPLTTSTAPDPAQPRSPSKKRGLGWPWDQPATHFPLYTPSSAATKTNAVDNISWLFNWELWVPGSLPQSIEWVPCVRTAAQCGDITAFLTDITSNQHRRVTHFLGFNEPEIPEQANLVVGDAVAMWQQHVLPAKARFGFRLGSPGMSSDVGRSCPWLDEFFDGLGGQEAAGVDFLVLHWYGLDFMVMRQFLEMMHQKYQLPIWLNEFACSSMGKGEAGQEDVERLLREAVPWLEETEWIERYAYFGHGQGQDVGVWVGRANNFTEEAQGCESTGGKRLSKIGRMYLEL